MAANAQVETDLLLISALGRDHWADTVISPSAHRQAQEHFAVLERRGPPPQNHLRVQQWITTVNVPLSLQVALSCAVDMSLPTLRLCRALNVVR